MTKEQFNNYNNYANEGSIHDDLNPAFILQGIHTTLLADVLAGKIDLNELAKREMEARGCNAKGKWVGFGKDIK